MFYTSRRPILAPPQANRIYLIAVDDERCDGCRLCTVFCPLGVLEIGPETNRRMLHFAVAANPQNCLGCGQCERLCPTAAIFVSETIQTSEASK